MATRSLNKVMLIGNLTRDPELRYTPQGTAVCTFGLATNRGWTTDAGEKKEEVEFHRIVSWNKLGELCSQLLYKGRRVFVEGRLQTRSWTAQDGTPRHATEIVIDEMLILDSKKAAGETEGAGIGMEGAVIKESPVAAEEPPPIVVEEPSAAAASPQPVTQGEDHSGKAKSPGRPKAEESKKEEKEDEVKVEDIPF